MLMAQKPIFTGPEGSSLCPRSALPLNILQGPQARQWVSVTSPRGAQGESCALRGVLPRGWGVMRSSAMRFQGPHKQGLPTQDS